jgi:hypothetical protein
MVGFEATDIGGNINRFQYTIETDILDGKRTATFRVYEIPPNLDKFFEYTFKFLDERTLKGEFVGHNGHREFSAKGLPEKIIEMASAEFNCNVESSPFQNPSDGNFLIKASQQAWERLLKSNSRTRKDEARKVYVLMRQEEPEG